MLEGQDEPANPAEIAVVPHAAGIRPGEHRQEHDLPAGRAGVGEPEGRTPSRKERAAAGELPVRRAPAGAEAAGAADELSLGPAPEGERAAAAPGMEAAAGVGRPLGLPSVGGGLEGPSRQRLALPEAVRVGRERGRVLVRGRLPDEDAERAGNGREQRGGGGGGERGGRRGGATLLQAAGQGLAGDVPQQLAHQHKEQQLSVHEHRQQQLSKQQ